MARPARQGGVPTSAQLRLPLRVPVSFEQRRAAPVIILSKAAPPHVAKEEELPKQRGVCVVLLFLTSSGRRHRAYIKLRQSSLGWSLVGD
jgi:hypothetical protein